MEALHRIHLAQHAHLDPEGRLRIDGPARHGTGLADLIVQIIVDVHDSHDTLHICFISKMYVRSRANTRALLP